MLIISDLGKLPKSGSKPPFLIPYFLKELFNLIINYICAFIALGP